MLMLCIDYFVYYIEHIYDTYDTILRIPHHCEAQSLSHTFV